VIWGTATDDSLGEDAKVTILATGMEDSLKADVGGDVHRNEDDYYEDIIRKLYKPVVKTPTMGTVITQTELPFEVDQAPEPEPAVIPEPEHEPEEKKEPTALDKMKAWLNGLMNNVTE
jgi:cell division protein FtsZ